MFEKIFKHHWKDTFAASLAVRLCCAALAIAAYSDLECNQFHVTNTNPHTEQDEDEEANKNFPNGFKVSGHFLLLIKALYGLSVSPRLWYNHLAETFFKYDLKLVLESECVFCNEKLILCFFVDDITVFYYVRNKNYFEELKTILTNTYNIRDIGEMKWFLGLRIIRDRSLRKLWTIQDSYVEKIATTYNRIDDHGNLKNIAPSTPMSTERILHPGKEKYLALKFMNFKNE